MVEIDETVEMQVQKHIEVQVEVDDEVDEVDEYYCYLQTILFDEQQQVIIEFDEQKVIEEVEVNEVDALEQLEQIEQIEK